MKKLSLVLFSLGVISSAALADITVPTFNGGFEATIEGLYLSTNDTNASYHDLSTAVLDGYYVYPTLGTIHTINAGYNWGFLLGIGYLFPNTGNDVQLNWTHLDTGTINGPHGSYVGTVDSEDYNTVTYSGQVKYNDDSVDLDIGQFINITNNLMARVYVGLRYLDLDRDLNSQATSNENYADYYYPVNNASYNIDSSFGGVGPLVGLAGTYNIANGFGVTGDIDSALLIGTGKTSGVLTLNSSVTQDGDYSSGSYQQVTHEVNQTSIVPVIDAKLGLDYSHQINHGMQLTVAAGYQAAEYFNVLNRVNSDAATAVALNPFTPIFGNLVTTPLIHGTSDVSFDGPYASLTIKA